MSSFLHFINMMSCIHFLVDFTEFDVLSLRACRRVGVLPTVSVKIFDHILICLDLIHLWVWEFVFTHGSNSCLGSVSISFMALWVGFKKKFYGTWVVYASYFDSFRKHQSQTVAYYAFYKKLHVHVLWGFPIILALVVVALVRIKFWR